MSDAPTPDPYKVIADLFFADLEKRVLAFMGKFLPENWDSMTHTERGVWAHANLGDLYASGGVVNAEHGVFAGTGRIGTARSIGMSPALGMGYHHPEHIVTGRLTGPALHGYSYGGLQMDKEHAKRIDIDVPKDTTLVPPVVVDQAAAPQHGYVPGSITHSYMDADGPVFEPKK